MVSPEHGVYVVLLGAFVTGAALAQAWTLSTTAALVVTFLGFQAEYPLNCQLKQRSSWKPRYLIWGSLYGLGALILAVGLAWQTPTLLWLYGGAIAALIIDAIEILRKERKSILNEGITFAAVCLAAPIAATATTGQLTPAAWGLWALNALYFSSSIFSIKLHKLKTSELKPGLIYHGLASLVIAGLYGLRVLPVVTVMAFGVAIAKFALIIWQQEWYCKAPIGAVATLETLFAFLFVGLAGLPLLPVHLSV